MSQRQFPADVEEYVGLAAGDGVRVRGAHRVVVEVEPLLLVYSERGVVTRPGPGAVVHDDGGEVVQQRVVLGAPHVAHEAGHVQRAQRERDRSVHLGPEIIVPPKPFQM